MSEAQRKIAEVLRSAWEFSHRHALTSTGVSDLVFSVQQSAIDCADWLMRTDPEFNRQAFLALAIDQPGITNAWDER